MKTLYTIKWRDAYLQLFFQIQLSHVSLEDSRNGKRQQVNQAWDFKQKLQENPLRFAFLDGRIDNVCPNSQEDTWVLNIKRGILSSLQNTMTDFNKDIKVTEVRVFMFLDTNI